MAKTKTFLIILIAIVIIILVALAVAFGIPKKEGAPGPEAPAIAENIYGLSGEIKDIKDKTLSVEAKILLADPQKEPIQEIVKVKIIDETKIVKLVFPKEIPEGSAEPFFPEETVLSFDNLKAGDKIDVKTFSDVSENIKNRTEIVAKTINVLE